MLFEILYLTADGTLRQTEFAGRAREAAMPRSTFERLQRAEVGKVASSEVHARFASSQLNPS